jgi:hypothetical protein
MIHEISKEHTFSGGTPIETSLKGVVHMKKKGQALHSS